MRPMPLTLALVLTTVAGIAWAGPVSGVGQANGPTRLRACASAIDNASMDAEIAATTAQRGLDNRTLVTAELAPCDCEEAGGSTYSPWRCIVPWRLVAMPAERHGSTRP